MATERPNPVGRSSGPIVCFRCNKVGHRQENCPDNVFPASKRGQSVVPPPPPRFLPSFTQPEISNTSFPTRFDSLKKQQEVYNVKISSPAALMSQTHNTQTMTHANLTDGLTTANPSEAGQKEPTDRVANANRNANVNPYYNLERNPSIDSNYFFFPHHQERATSAIQTHPHSARNLSRQFNYLPEFYVNESMNAGPLFVRPDHPPFEDSDEILRCYNCDEIGHLSRDCNRPRACFLCDETNHITKNCRYLKDTNIEQLKSSLRFSKGAGNNSTPNLIKASNTTVGGNLQNLSSISTSFENPSVSHETFEANHQHQQQQQLVSKNLHSLADYSGNQNVNICLNCNEIGHKLKECPQQKKCFLCNEVGHVIKECAVAVIIKQKIYEQKRVESQRIQQNLNYSEHQNFGTFNRTNSLESNMAQPFVQHGHAQLTGHNFEEQGAPHSRRNMTVPPYYNFNNMHNMPHLSHMNNLHNVPNITGMQTMNNLTNMPHYTTYGYNPMQQLTLQQQMNMLSMFPVNYIYDPNNNPYLSNQHGSQQTQIQTQLVSQGNTFQHNQNLTQSQTSTQQKVSEDNLRNIQAQVQSQIKQQKQNRSFGSVELQEALERAKVDQQQQINERNAEVSKNTNSYRDRAQTQSPQAFASGVSPQSPKQTVSIKSTASKTIQLPTITKGITSSMRKELLKQQEKQDRAEKQDVSDFNFDRNTNENSETSSFGFGFPNYLNPKTQDFKKNVEQDTTSRVSNQDTATLGNEDFHVAQLVDSLELQ